MDKVESENQERNLETRNHNGFRFPFWIPGFQIYPDRLLPDSFLIAFLDLRVSGVYKAKEPTTGWLFRKHFPDAPLGFFPEWHSYEAKTKKAQT